MGPSVPGEGECERGGEDVTKGSPGYRTDVMAGGAIGRSAERGQEPGERVLGGETSLAPDVLLTLRRCSGNVYGLKRPTRLKENTRPKGRRKVREQTCKRASSLS